MKTFKRVSVIAVLCFIMIIVFVIFFQHSSAELIPTEKIRISEDFRPRTIVTTDGECDDLNSFIHLLLCANDIDIRGIVLTSSCYHYAGDAERGIMAYRWGGEEWLERYISAYGKVYANLASHDFRYPSPDALRAVTKTGNIRSAGDMSESTEGSRLIKEEILKDESSPLYLQCWGGSNSVARALMDIEAEYGSTADWPEHKELLSSKLVLYLISTQDDTYEEYIAVTWPHVTVLHNKKGFEALAFNWINALPRWETKKQ